MGNYEEAIAISHGVDPDVTQTASYKSVKYGVCMNMQEVDLDHARLPAYRRSGRQWRPRTGGHHGRSRTRRVLMR